MKAALSEMEAEQMGLLEGFRTAEKAAKYLNSPESDIYHKSRVLYGLFFAKKDIIKNDKCFLVEGYTDVISMHQEGIENVVASSVTALTQEQVRLIKRFTKNILKPERTLLKPIHFRVQP